ncbi:hypothetical protein VNO77_03416 [Canavalia gladiata]|uniref:Uncharacterized protein n=1 Tax=Canavalia gladiata TaxID=3824 RepID=A0AAN9MVB7_CANGL
MLSVKPMRHGLGGEEATSYMDFGVGGDDDTIIQAQESIEEVEVVQIETEEITSHKSRRRKEISKKKMAGKRGLSKKEGVKGGRGKKLHKVITVEEGDIEGLSSTVGDDVEVRNMKDKPRSETNVKGGLGALKNYEMWKVY